MTLVLLIFLIDDRDSVPWFDQRIRLLTGFDVLEFKATRNQKPFTIVACEPCLPGFSDQSTRGDDRLCERQAPTKSFFAGRFHLTAHVYELRRVPLQRNDISGPDEQIHLSR